MRVRWARFPLAIAFATPWLQSCFAIVDRSADQCVSTQECRARGSGFESAVCSDGVCGALPCNTSARCRSALKSATAICRSGQCVELTSKDCMEVAPADALDADNPVVVGWMGPLVGKNQSIGTPIHQAMSLAFSEVNNRAGGIPTESGARRKLLAVLCHDLDDADRAAGHLVNVVGVPAIIGPTFSGITIGVATGITIPAGVLTLSPSATSPDITDIPDQGLVWRTVPSDSIQAIPLRLLVSEVEEDVRNEQGLQPSDSIRVAMTVKGDAYGLGLADAVLSGLTFNGQSAAANSGNFQRYNYGDGENPNVDFVPALATDFKPHIVIALGTNEAIADILAGVEDNWPSGTPRPRYVLPDGGRLTELLDLADIDDTLASRVIGTVPGRRTDQYDAFSLRFKGVFTEEPGTYAENAYDAAYLTAFAAVYSGGDQLTGAALAEALKQMVTGPLTKAAPADLNKGFATLSQGLPIDFDGVSGPLNFDVDSGEAPVDIDIWCVERDTTTGKSVFVSSGRFYDHQNNRLAGTGALCDG